MKAPGANAWCLLSRVVFRHPPRCAVISNRRVRIKEMTSFEAAQDDILTSAPEVFTFSNPPSIGWWRAKFSLDLAAAAFVYFYQSILGKKAYPHDGTFWQADFASRWQAAAGITPKQWNGAKAELSAVGTPLLSFSIHAVKGRKGVWIRPSDQLLAAFGIALQTYDAVCSANSKISRQLDPFRGVLSQFKGVTIPVDQPLTHEELDAVAVWTARGGLARLGNAEHLGKQLDAYNASKSAAHA
jgi:hypothetical protein